MAIKQVSLIAGFIAVFFLLFSSGINAVYEGYWTDDGLTLVDSSSTLLKVTNGKLYLTKSKTSSGTSKTFLTQTVGVNGIAATISAAAASDEYLVTALAVKEYVDYRASQVWPDAETADFDIDDYVDSDDMIGMIMPVAYDNTSAVEATGRWLRCEGQEVTTANYPTLNARIGYTYGGTATGFKLPNLAAKAILGAGSGSGLTSRSVAATGGAARITLTTNNLPQHNHGVTDPTHVHGMTTFSWTNGYENDTHYNFTSPTTFTTLSNVISSAITNISLGSTGGNSSYNHMSPYSIVRYYIRVR